MFVSGVIPKSPQSVRLAPVRFGMKKPANQAQAWKNAMQQYPYILDQFKAMAEIPTPAPNRPDISPEHQKQAEIRMTEIRQLLMQRFQALGITHFKTQDGHLLIQIPASPGFEKYQPLVLLGHMDIVPASTTDPLRPIQPQIQTDNGKIYITSNGDTTLGADNKASIAVMIDTVARLLGKHPQQQSEIPHGPLEILLAPDEEIGCPTYRQLPVEKLLTGKDIICVDGEDENKIIHSLASGVNIDIDITGLSGGHSGMDAVKTGANEILVEIMYRLKNQHGNVIEFDADGKPEISKNSVLKSQSQPGNMIASSAGVMYKLRSHSVEKQEAELKRIQTVVADVVDEFQKSTGETGLTGTVTIERFTPPSSGDTTSRLYQTMLDASRHVFGKRSGLERASLDKMHAATQANMIAGKRNQKGEPLTNSMTISPWIRHLHNVKEMTSAESMHRTSLWLTEGIKRYFQDK